MADIGSLVLELRTVRLEEDQAIAEARAATERAKAKATERETLEEQIRQALLAEQLFGGADEPSASGTWGSVRLQRAKPSVRVTAPDLLPATFWRVKPAPPPEPDKTAIGKAMAAGEAVPGAVLVESWSVRTS